MTKKCAARRRRPEVVLDWPQPTPRFLLHGGHEIEVNFGHGTVVMCDADVEPIGKAFRFVERRAAPEPGSLRFDPELLREFCDTVLTPTRRTNRD